MITIKLNGLFILLSHENQNISNSKIERGKIDLRNSVWEVSHMYITANRDRWLNVTIATLILLIIIALLKYDSYTLVYWDAHLQTHLAAQGTTLFNKLFSALANPIMGGIYAVALWFFLWGFKHKLIATWVLGTYFIGQLWFVVLRWWVARPRPAAHSATLTSASFPSHHFFTVVLLCYLVWIAVFPWITENWHRWLLTILMIALCLLVALAQIRMNAAFPIDMVGTLLLTYIWGQIAQAIYLNWFARLQNLTIFRHSDFN